MVRALFVIALSSSVLIGCSAEILAIEVLPPRTSATCSAPTKTDPAAGRGLLDLDATQEMHGAYLADLRISTRSDLRIDGISLAFSLPGDAGDDTQDAALDAGGEQPLGDLLLTGQDDEVRVGIVENVSLLPRALALALRADTELETSPTEYETVVVEIQATAGGEPIGTTSSTFAIDVCQGCLVQPPEEGACEDGITETRPCRPGQDVVMYRCADPPSGGLF